ncbi:hypothetical protein DPMN_016307 [Dreissena polymorpha]|uniref:Uncharacterized protein n=1 Tax=Dreissena polymorpha TaxID=45954 RepID=A0A9D4NEB8_DREPO|nr:hypothetical protein DPMN_016307 [Dreissena polymorpha]
MAQSGRCFWVQARTLTIGGNLACFKSKTIVCDVKCYWVSVTCFVVRTETANIRNCSRMAIN